MNSKEVSELFNLSIDTLRYYEKAGVIPPVTRSENGYRDYQIRDLNWIYLAKTLRKAGMSIDSLQEFARLAQLHDVANENVEIKQKQILIDQLEAVDEKLEEMQQARDLLAYKVKTYDDHIAKFKNGELLEKNSEKLWELNPK
ncbi:MerR family transcriptional regulator [Carnobacterium maltaromaticum]|uniref:MerR family transcriptional regulator n=1 Tax=Carnobacterium maltaromaticum TaxID=2751 RepID=UPI0012FAA698|nr:MerR family transcriptional regulator [Carnobacterium maltaromaticum]MBC9788956.1 MerR family DNA-binding transcriptional regulator [Carnobacterium maltaromaticum]